MQHFTVETAKHREVVDITDEINRRLQKSKVQDGLCHVFCLHTTTCLTTACLDPGTDLDTLDAFEAMVPKLTYRHPHDPSHVGDHIISSAVGPSILLPFEKKELVLGTWQRVIFVDMDGPRPRQLVMSVIESQ